MITGKPKLTCVCDYGLVRHTAPRRFLTGLGAYLDIPIYVTRSTLDAVSRGIAFDVRRRLYSIMKKCNFKGDVESDNLLESVSEEISAWFVDGILSGQYILKLLPSESNSYRDRYDLIENMPDNILYSEIDSVARHYDFETVIEPLQGGGDLFLTNYTYTINHKALNKWVVQDGLREDDFIYYAVDGLSQLLGDEFGKVSHLIGLCTTMSRTDQSMETNLFNLMRFAEGLRDVLGLCSNAILHESKDGGEEAQERYRSAQQLIFTEPWVKARSFEAEGVRILNKAIDVVTQR